MSRRPARFTESDINRAVKVAEKRGPAWKVRVAPDGAIEILREKDSGEKQATEAEEFERYQDRVF